MYNLGNTLSQQQKFQDAMEQYVAAGKIEKDKMKLATDSRKIVNRIYLLLNICIAISY